ncbi:Translation factor pelota [Puccinia graminis f. sp. tritici]|uniref:Translation factor pelota n=1 Tax=Puccinia graminis f. sp. tritici TaxID=56615 RepID=A0A5B0LTW1_PUCGR|nr:Translation factor pelota [Puccinia graminis f. sp. tritici]KAA1092217.1 Translation factor pelota [Puccinia graminis f. sp. tritici]
MKQIRTQIEKNKSGFVTLKAENDEDMWHAYNLVTVGDEVRSIAVRKIVVETNSATGSKDSHRVKLNLTIEVKKVNYSGVEIPSSGDGNEKGLSIANQPTGSSSSGGASLHLSGQISKPNEHVKMGAFHTLDLEPEREFTIIKGPDGWDSVHVQRLADATDASKSAEVAAILADDTGRATVCLIGTHTTLIKQRIEVPLSKNKKPGQTADKTLDKFHKQIYDSILKHFNFSLLRMVIIASPGNTKDTVFEAILAQAIKANNKAIITSKSKFQRIYTPTIHLQSLNQILSTPEILNQLKDTKYSKEIQALNKFQKMLEEDVQRALYGEVHVDRAAERAAIGSLLISDSLFRNPDPEKRKKFIKLTESVQQFGGEVLVFSSMHSTGTRLNELTGVAAILTYPLDMDLIDQEENEA